MKRIIAVLVPVVLITVLTPAAASAGSVGDSHRGLIAFNRANPDGETNAIFVTDPSGANERMVAPLGDTPKWSPDGRRLAYGDCTDEATSNCAGTVLDVRSGQARVLPLPGRLDAYAPNVWSPDGRLLAGGGLSDSHPARNGIYTVRSSDGKGLQRLTRDPGGQDIPGAFSPDGRQLVFVRNDLVDGEAVAVALFILDTRTRHVRRLTPARLTVNAEHGGDWSPDGQRIVFDARPTPDSRFTIYTINADGTDLRRVHTSLACGASADDVNGFGCFAPGWSPDGSQIVFGSVSAATGERHLYRVAASGGQVHQVTFGDGEDDVPDWG